MNNLARAGLEQVIDMLQMAQQLTMTGIEATLSIVNDSDSPLLVGEKSADDIIKEVKGLQSQEIFALHALLDAMSEPVGVPAPQQSDQPTTGATTPDEASEVDNNDSPFVR